MDKRQADVTGVATYVCRHDKRDCGVGHKAEHSATLVRKSPLKHIRRRNLTLMKCRSPHRFSLATLLD